MDPGLGDPALLPVPAAVRLADEQALISGAWERGDGHVEGDHARTTYFLRPSSGCGISLCKELTTQRHPRRINVVATALLTVTGDVGASHERSRRINDDQASRDQLAT